MGKRKSLSVILLLMAVCLIFLLPVNVQAASKLRSKFDHKASGNIYYYDKKGKLSKGW